MPLRMQASSTSPDTTSKAGSRQKNRNRTRCKKKKAPIQIVVPPWAHPELDPRYKTKPCNNWKKSAGTFCPSGDMCRFAHGDEELQENDELLPREGPRLPEGALEDENSRTSPEECVNRQHGSVDRRHSPQPPSSKSLVRDGPGVTPTRMHRQSFPQTGNSQIPQQQHRQPRASSTHGMGDHSQHPSRQSFGRSLSGTMGTQPVNLSNYQHMFPSSTSSAVLVSTGTMHGVNSADWNGGVMLSTGISSQQRPHHVPTSSGGTFAMHHQHHQESVYHVQPSGYHPVHGLVTPPLLNVQLPAHAISAPPPPPARDAQHPPRPQHHGVYPPLRSHNIGGMVPPPAAPLLTQQHSSASNPESRSGGSVWSYRSGGGGYSTYTPIHSSQDSPPRHRPSSRRSSRDSDVTSHWDASGSGMWGSLPLSLDGSDRAGERGAYLEPMALPFTPSLTGGVASGSSRIVTSDVSPGSDVGIANVDWSCGGWLGASAGDDADTNTGSQQPGSMDTFQRWDDLSLALDAGLDITARGPEHPPSML